MTVPGPKNLNSESEISPDKKTVQASPVVRFASENEEIEPQQSLDTTTTSAPHIDGAEDSKVKELTQSLQGAQLAGRRMSCFAFEPVSLPASRVCPFLYLSVNPELYTTRWMETWGIAGDHWEAWEFIPGSRRCLDPATRCPYP